MATESVDTRSAHPIYQKSAPHVEPNQLDPALPSDTRWLFFLEMPGRLMIIHQFTMKTLALVSLMALAALRLLRAQEVSIFSFLENRASVNIKSDNLAGAVGQLISQVKDSIPEARDCKFVFSGTHHKTPPEGYNLVLPDTKIRHILKQLGDFYSHRVRYDIANGTITFTAVTGSGADPQRKYRFSPELSKNMALDWSSKEKAEESLYRHKVVLNFAEINLAERTVTASGALSELDYLDMVIAVHGKEPWPKAAPAGSD